MREDGRAGRLLSAGFLEPLEATGIGLVEMGTYLLAHLLPMDACFDRAAAHFNRMMSERYTRIRNVSSRLRQCSLETYVAMVRCWRARKVRSDSAGTISFSSGLEAEQVTSGMGLIATLVGGIGSLGGLLIQRVGCLA